MSKTGKVIRRKVVNRKGLKEFAQQSKPTLIAMEACGGSHYWARYFRNHGHSIKMMSAHRVKAFAPANKKNDPSDAEAICLAARAESVPSVRVKGAEQQDIDIVMNLREQLRKFKVAMTNQVHSIGLEFGILLPKEKGPTFLAKVISELEDATNELTTIARETIEKCLQLAKEAENQIHSLDKRLERSLTANENYHLLQTIPGVGPLSAAAILAQTGGNVSDFRNGRQFSAFLGLCPAPTLHRRQDTACGDHKIRIAVD